MNTALRVLLLVVLIWLSLPAGGVQAHAHLLRSTPGVGEALAQFPTTVELAFSEAVEPADVSVRLVDAAGVVIADGQVMVDGADPTVLRAQLPTQPKGVYSLDWRVRSAVDGHTNTGTIAFSVGTDAPRASLLPPPGTPDPATDLPKALDMLLRAVSYLGAALLAGAVVFGTAVWRPVVRGQAPPLPDWDGWMTGWLRRQVQVGAALTLAGVVGLVVWQTTQAAQVSTAPLLLRLMEGLGHSAGLFWIRMILLPLLFVMAVELPAAGERDASMWWGAALMSAMVLLAFALSGHSAAAGPRLAVVVDWLHLAGMASWLGGLLPLGVLLWRQARAKAVVHEAVALALVARRFSRVALLAVAVLGLTGLYSAWLHIATMEALTSTRYGQTVLVKCGLFAVLIGLGAANQLGILPRMAKPGSNGARRLGHAVRVEVGVGALLLVAVGGLMSLPPAYDALQAHYRLGYQGTYYEGQVQLDLRVAPAVVGENEFEVVVQDGRPGAAGVTPQVLLRIAGEGGDEIQVEAAPVEQAAAENERNHYRARGSYFSQMGTWQVEVIVRRPGFDDARNRFVLDLAKLAAARGEMDGIRGGE